MNTLVLYYCIEAQVFVFYKTFLTHLSEHVLHFAQMFIYISVPVFIYAQVFM